MIRDLGVDLAALEEQVCATDAGTPRTVEQAVEAFLAQADAIRRDRVREYVTRLLVRTRDSGADWDAIDDAIGALDREWAQARPLHAIRLQASLRQSLDARDQRS